jgi:general secretion pathway protein M
MGRVIAALLFVLVLALAALAAVVPFLRSAALSEEIVAMRDLVAQRERLRFAASGRPTQDGRDALLNGESSGILGADLQRRITDLARHNGMALRSTQVLPARRDADLTVVGLEASLHGEIAGLRNLLYAIETGAPVLLVDALSVKTAATPEAGMRPVALEITLKVRGYGAAKETD